MIPTFQGEPERVSIPADIDAFTKELWENLDPLPSFEGEPRKVAVTAPDAKTLANELWVNLNADNKVSLFVEYIDLASGARDSVIINKHN